MKTHCTVALSLLVICAVGAEASDWFRFRGPNGSGLSDTTELPVEFGPGKNMLWKTPLPPGHSSPIFSRESVFLTSWEGDKLLTFAIDRESGRIRWRREIQRERAGELEAANSPASPSPVTDGENVYVYFQDFGIASYGPDGDERWTLALQPPNNPFGVGTSPILADGKVILVSDADTDSFIIAIEKDTGKVAWRKERPLMIRGFSTPVLWRPSGGGPLQVVVAGSFQLESYAVESGEKLWWVRGLTWQPKPTPIVDGDVIYVQNWAGGANYGRQRDIMTFAEALETYDKNSNGGIDPDEAPERGMAPNWHNFDLDRDGVMATRDWEFYRRKGAAVNAIQAIRLGGQGDMTDNAFLWRYYKSLPNVPSPLLYQGVIYMVRDGGILTTLDSKTGEVLKQDRLGALGRYFAAPVAADGKVYTTSEDGQITVLKPGGDWEVLAINDMGDAAYGTPAPVDGKLYVRTNAGLYCFAKMD